jgi:hypothetical protein
LDDSWRVNFRAAAANNNGLKSRRFQAELRLTDGQPGGNTDHSGYFLSAFLTFFSAFFSFMVLAGSFFSDFLLSIPLLMSVLLCWAQSVHHSTAGR